MSLSPWFLVGSALILELAIAFWAVKNTRQERETMVTALLERSGALMWAMEGGARAGMGMQRTAFYLQYMLEETVRQPDITYIAVITRQGDIVAHSDRARIGERLYSAAEMEGMALSQQINWRIRESGSERIFESYRLFSPLPGFREHMRHGRHGRGWHMMSGRMNNAGCSMPPCVSPTRPDREKGRDADDVFAQPGREGAAPPSAFACPAPLREGGPGPAGQAVNALGIVVGLDMAAFDKALIAAERSTLFTALLVGLLGVGGFISLFWAQSYRLSRRMLMDARALASEVVSSLPLGLIIVDASERVAHANALAENLLGRPLSALRNKALVSMEGLDWSGISARVKQGQSVLEEEHALVRKEGGEGVPVSLSASRIRNERGDDLGMLFLLRDMREMKRLQAELRRSERLSTLGNMAARVAHEIRNPLSSIKGFATYLASRREDDADQEAARTMIGEVERLNRVVSELLDFARPPNLNIAPADPAELMRRVMRLASVDAGAKGVDLRLGRLAEGGRAAVDAERITQALLNLVLNAVQATDQGGSVTLSVLPPESGRAVLVIEDSGRGMTREMLAQVFSPYFTTKAAGTGLGLSIVARIVEDHCGEIALESDPGRGTRVTLRLPLAEDPKGERHA
jgi:two-component system sensor histidine kinase HydH